MERIRNILAAMTKAEVRYLRTFLAAFVGKGEDNKALALIEMLINYPDTSPEDACETLYGIPSTAAFKMLVSRLEDRMLECLQLDTSLSKNETLKMVPNDYIRVRLHLRFSQALILFNRGMIAESGEMFQQLARDASQVGLYDLKLSALRYYHITTLRGQWTDDMVREQQEANDQFQAVYEVQSFHATITNMQRLVGIGVDTQNMVKEHLIQQLPRLEQLVQKTHAPLASYLFLQLRRMLAQYNDDLPGEDAILEEMLLLIEYSKLLQQTKRILTVRYDKAVLLLRLYRFEECLALGVPLLQEFKPDKQGTVRTLLAYAAYYLGYWQDALTHVQEMSNRILGLSDFLRASIAWQTGNFKLAKQHLRDCTPLLGDKSGWNTGLRTFEILLLIDSGEQDLATARVESLRKHIERYSSEPRETLINRYLRALERNAYNFSRPSKDMTSLLEQILATRWYAYSHEPVRFEAWAMSRTGTISYAEAFRLITPPQYLPSHDSPK